MRFLVVMLFLAVSIAELQASPTIAKDETSTNQVQLS